MSDISQLDASQMEQTKTPWFKRPRGIVFLILVGAFALVGVTESLGGSAEAETFTGGETVTPVAASTGDWSSGEAYRADLVDTADKVGDLLGTVSDISTSVGNGEMGIDTYVVLMESAIEAVDSHRDHFQGTTPPAGFEATHRHLLNALDLFSEAFNQAHDGAETLDIGLIEDSIATMNRGSIQIEKATQALPS